MLYNRKTTIGWPCLKEPKFAAAGSDKTEACREKDS